MPKKLAYHCAAMYGDNIYIYGGFEYPSIPNGDTFILNLKSKLWEVVPSQGACDYPPIWVQICDIWKGEYLVVPTYNFKTFSPCTALLNLKSKKWITLKEDKRNSVVSGQILKLVFPRNFANINFFISKQSTQ